MNCSEYRRKKTGQILKGCLCVPLKTGLVVKVKKITKDMYGELSTELNKCRRNVWQSTNRSLE
jgi:hypothetical protein